MKRKNKVPNDTKRCPNGWPVSKDFKTWPVADQEEWILSAFRDEYTHNEPKVWSRSWSIAASSTGKPTPTATSRT